MKYVVALLCALPVLGQYTFSGIYCASATGNDSYACTLNTTVVSYQTGAFYSFKADVANTGTASINFNSLGGKTIVKAQGGVTTTLADNDIRAGQVLVVQYDGTNMQMQSTLGNAPSASGSTTVNGQTCSIGSSCTVTVPASTGITGLGTNVATALAANVGAANGIVAPALYWTNYRSYGATMLTATANATSCSGTYIQTPITFGHMVVTVLVADNTNASDVGIYNGSGTLIADAGAFTSATTGIRTFANAQGTVTVPPGKMFICMTSAGSTFRLGGDGTNTSWLTFFSVSSATSGGALNSSFTPIAESLTFTGQEISIILVP